MFALAGLFACVLVVMYLAVNDRLLESTAVVIVLPMALVGLGAFALQRLVRVNASIDQQLQQIPRSALPLGSQLAFLPEMVPQAQGWNTLVQQIRDHLTLASLDTHLSAAFDTVQQQSWQPVFHSLPDGVIVADRAGRATRANRSALTLLGLANEAQLHGKHVLDLLLPRLSAESGRLLSDLPEGTAVVQRDLQLGAALADGVWRVARLPLLGDNAGAGSVIWTVRDVTQLRLADEARKQFVFTAAHELRTPLANIQAYAETLATHTNIDIEQQKSFVNVINAEATRVARLVSDLLDVSQMETGAIAFTPSDTDVQRLLTELVEHVAPTIDQKHIVFHTSFPPKFPQLYVDKDKLSAALLNLVGNALKYTPEGGQVRFEVHTDASQIHFKVEDSGIGIAPEELAQVGQKFFRSKDARVAAITGSGLGLAFTREVVKLHGGHLAIVSELNKGSQFTLSLPLA